MMIAFPREQRDTWDIIWYFITQIIGPIFQDASVLILIKLKQI